MAQETPEFGRDYETTELLNKEEKTIPTRQILEENRDQKDLRDHRAETSPGARKTEEEAKGGLHGWPTSP